MKDTDRFDRWFKSLPFRKQADLRRQGVIPYDEMPTDDNVFPVVEDHKTWTYVPPDDDRSESTSFISEDEVRDRIAALLNVLESFADRKMKLHLRFVRNAVTSGACDSYTELAKEFGITKQAMTWRSRQIRAALGRIASRSASSGSASHRDHNQDEAHARRIGYKPRTTRDSFDDDLETPEKTKQPNESIYGKEEGSCSLRLREVPKEVRNPRRKDSGLSTRKVSTDKRSKESNAQAVARGKRSKTR